MRAERELPVVWAVAKGSLLNKLILVPSALLISAFLPWLIVALQVIGALYLCYEAVADPNIDLVILEKKLKEPLIPILSYPPKLR